MKHLEFDRNGKKYALTGSVITVYRFDGLKLKQWFYEDHEQAKRVFLQIAA